MAALCLPGPIKPTIHFKWSIEVFPDLHLTSKQELKIKLDYCLLTSLNNLYVNTSLRRDSRHMWRHRLWFDQSPSSVWICLIMGCQWTISTSIFLIFQTCNQAIIISATGRGRERHQACVLFCVKWRRDEVKLNVTSIFHPPSTLMENTRKQSDSQNKQLQNQHEKFRITIVQAL